MTHPLRELADLISARRSIMPYCVANPTQELLESHWQTCVDPHVAAIVSAASYAWRDLVFALAQGVRSTVHYSDPRSRAPRTAADVVAAWAKHEMHDASPCGKVLGDIVSAEGRTGFKEPIASRHAHAAAMFLVLLVRCMVRNKVMDANANRCINHILLAHEPSGLYTGAGLAKTIRDNVPTPKMSSIVETCTYKHLDGIK